MRSRPGSWLVDRPIAHRGLHDPPVPENSLGAFERAVESGYAIELDVRLTSDDQLIVMHDSNTFRMTGSSAIIASTSSARLTNLVLLGTPERVPLLSESLLHVGGRVPVLIELKTERNVRRVGPALLRCLRDYQGGVAVQSFDPVMLLWLRIRAPWICRGQLAGSSGDRRWMSPFRRIMFFNLFSQPDFIAYHLASLPRCSVRAWLRVLKVPLVVWTVDRDDQLVAARSYGANVIFEKIRPAV